MELLERIWELLGVVFGGLLRSFERAITTLFGSSNARYLKRLQSKVDAINALEPKYKAMSDEELRRQTSEFRKRLAAGETLDDLLVEAFAVCREASRRWIGLRHYDVQLIGGMVLHSGAIAEMATGEGKTLVATLPAYLNALAGKGVHVVTVNPYLARRDMEWMGPIYIGLGLTVGAIYPDMDTEERQRAYDCDITYGTNNEFGFDYLRDNMKPAAKGDDTWPRDRQQVQGRLHFALIDEVDNILIDEARTPLIIAGPAHDDTSRYAQADKIARQLTKDLHFEVKEKEHSVHLTDEGVRMAERLAGVESFYTAGNMDWPHLIDNSLKAHYLYRLDVNYVIHEQTREIIIVDEFTGRLMPGRQWSDGLHQAVEAKEGVPIKQESQTYATITLQNFFKLYGKLAGMTGTAMTEANEFWKIYKLDVISIPTNRAMQRINHPDVVYRTEREKYEAVADEIERLHKWDVISTSDGKLLLGAIHRETEEAVEFQPHDTKQRETIPRKKISEIQRKGRPVLVGTVSIEKSERLSSLLNRRGIPHQVLNAKHHQREAEIVSQAGRKGAVTIATNMAGRGTDIILGGNPETMAWAQLQDKYPTRLEVPKQEWDALVAEIEAREKMKPEGEEVRALGGLHVVGTERHESRRIDLQLRGRTGRQGDPGTSRFYLSLEDDLMRIFGGEWVKNMLTRLGMQEGDAIESGMVTRRIEGAQKKVEERNFEARKQLLEYDQVMDEQRKRVYGFRQQILSGVNCKTKIQEMIAEQVHRHLGDMLDKDYGSNTFAAWAASQLSTELEPRDFRGMDFAMADERAHEEALRAAETAVFDAVEENLPADAEEDEWNWEALAKFANTRWKLNLRDRDLKAVGREGVVELVLERAREAILKVDLAEGARFLEPNFGLQSVVAWMHYKFGVSIAPDSLSGREPADVEQEALRLANAAYEQKEAEFPVMAVMRRFAQYDGSGKQIGYDREALVAWARQRFNIELNLDDLRNKQRDEIHQMLVDHSRRHAAQAAQVLVEVNQKVQSLFGSDGVSSLTAGLASGGNGSLASLSDWIRNTLHCDLPPEKLADMDRHTLELKLEAAVEDRFRPEARRLERSLMLQILDTAWKDHLLAMDHLRNSVGLRGYAQVDPKVEYRREGMRTFERMWISLGEQTTDLIFRMEELDDGFVRSTWAESKAVHQEAPSASSIAAAQQQAIASSSTPEKREPFRKRQQTVGRNDPCPCGSGKKYKQCCMRHSVT